MQLGFLSGLSGEVPGSLGSMHQLGYLDLSGNMLTGTLPPLASSQLITLRLDENFLTGTIPASYGALLPAPSSFVCISTQVTRACPWYTDSISSTLQVHAVQAMLLHLC